MRDAFALREGLTFLNHGSFGACPRVVLEAQVALRARLEADPVHFFMRDLEGLQDEAREVLAGFVGADAQDLVFVRNATEGVNTVLRSLSFAPGDELLTTDHAYNACANALRFAAERAGATIVVAKVPFPGATPEAAQEAVLARVTPRTRLALLDAITSPTGLVLPFGTLVAALETRGVPTLLDAAHAPGMVPLDLRTLGAAYVTGNLHKWVCAPKGAGFLFVRRALQPGVRPLCISHGANSARRDRPRFWLEFDWTGTSDPTAPLCVPAALKAVAALHPDGWDGVRAANRAMVIDGRRLLLRVLGGEEPCPESMLGSLASVVLPQPASGPGALPGDNQLDPLQERLFREANLEVPVFTFAGQRCLRISAQRYNTLRDYQKLADALGRLL